MEGFNLNPFKKEAPLTRERLEERATTERESLQKTGEILRGMREIRGGSGEPAQEAAPPDRNAQNVEALGKAIDLLRENARALPGYDHLLALRDELKGKTTTEKTEALCAFDREFRGTKSGIEDIIKEIRRREAAIEALKNKKGKGATPFEPLEEAA